jgi:hypothetical protein
VKTAKRILLIPCFFVIISAVATVVVVNVSQVWSEPNQVAAGPNSEVFLSENDVFTFNKPETVSFRYKKPFAFVDQNNKVYSSEIITTIQDSDRKIYKINNVSLNSQYKMIIGSAEIYSDQVVPLTINNNEIYKYDVSNLNIYTGMIAIGFLIWIFIKLYKII